MTKTRMTYMSCDQIAYKGGPFFQLKMHVCPLTINARQLATPERRHTRGDIDPCSHSTANSNITDLVFSFLFNLFPMSYYDILCLGVGDNVLRLSLEWCRDGICIDTVIVATVMFIVVF
jgi:hypothetical protein